MILRISYKDHVTNEKVRAKIQQAIGPHKDLLIIVKRLKLQWYGHASHTLFNIFLKRIMTDALEDHEGTINTGGRTITNLRFADDIDGLAGEEEELANSVERLDKGSTAYGMEISAEKT